jgi:hypothetical protein
MILLETSSFVETLPHDVLNYYYIARLSRNPF